MGAGPDNELLGSPGNFFPVRKRSVAELFAELLGRSFLAFPHFATVDYHVMRVAFPSTSISPNFTSRAFMYQCSAASRSKARDGDSKTKQPFARFSLGKA